jgi:single-stranded-DNA-specific exonuclease
LEVDAEVPLGALGWPLYHELERLAPFGYGNAPPTLVSRRVRVLSGRRVGVDGRHLKLSVQDEKGRSWNAIAFRQGGWSDRLPRAVDLAYHLERNEWRDTVSLQLNVQDIHPPGEV